MAGSSFGTIFRITTWGESHGAGIGVVVDGCPAGVSLTDEDIQIYLNRRKPGQSRFSTPRKEDDKVRILSGVFEGRTTGTPISLVVENNTQRSSDYSEIASYYRPGHADYTFDEKYGFRDYRGGGRSSGRETIGRVAAGAIAAKVLSELGIEVFAYTKSIGDVSISMDNFDRDEIFNNMIYMPDKDAAVKAEKLIDDMRNDLESIGGVVECTVKNMITGAGEPVFDKLDANLAKAIVSIGAVKAFEIGNGTEASKSAGSSNNDSFACDENGHIYKKTNNSGGTLGGISDGSDIVIRAHFKPTPSIFKEQQTVNKNGENISINIKGRHDPVIVPRAVVVVEAMTAITVLDMILLSMSSSVDKIKKVLGK